MPLALTDADTGEDPLAPHLPQFEGKTLLVLGDAMLDRYVLGAAERMSPEAPIPVLHVRGRRRTLGGAGNVAQNAAALGARAILVSVVGDDAPAAEIADLLAHAPAIENALVAAPRSGEKCGAVG